MASDDEPGVIRVPGKIEDEAVIEAWQAQWDQASSIEVELPDKLADHEARHLYDIFVKHRRNVVAMEVLFALAEHPDTPSDVLRLIYQNGDTGCQVSVCLRPDLPRDLVAQCLESTSLDVLEHVIFSERVSIEDCQVLMRTERGRKIWSAIERAIAMKRCR